MSRYACKGCGMAVEHCSCFWSRTKPTLPPNGHVKVWVWYTRSKEIAPRIVRIDVDGYVYSTGTDDFDDLDNMNGWWSRPIAVPPGPL